MSRSTAIGGLPIRHEMLGWLPLILLLCLAAVAVQPTRADALSIRQTVDRELSFAGTSCEEITERVALPSRTRNARLLKPAVGDPVFDLDGLVVASVVRAQIAGIDGRRMISVTVRGDQSMCPDSPEDPSTAAPVAWEGVLDASARVRRTFRVFFPQVCCDNRHDERPSKLYLGASFFLDQVRWSRWGGRIATGRAQLPWNSCDPSCAEGHITWIPARVRLSRPRRCNGVYQYLTVRYTMTRRPPSGSRSSRSSFGFRCQ